MPMCNTNIRCKVIKMNKEENQGCYYHYKKEEKWYKQVAETSIFTTFLSPSGNMIIIE
jgi:hypothetical protein